MGLRDKAIDKTIPVPLFYQLKTLILDEIKQDHYKAGDMIPTAEELSNIFEISRTTIRQAITELVQEGWLYRVKGKGTFVTRPKIEHSFIKKVESFNDEMTRIGMVPSTEVLDLKIITAGPKVAKGLKINEKDQVVYLFRKRMADGEPIVTIRTYLPYRSCAYIMEHDFEQESLYHMLSEKEETRVCMAHRTIEAVEATTEDARYMEIKPGKAIQLSTTVGYNIFSQPIEYSIARYRGDRSSFDVNIRIEM